MGLPVPDPRVPEHTPAERELIDTMLPMIDELRLLRERLAAAPAIGEGPMSKVDGPKMLDVNGTANYLGVSTGLVRNLIVQRRLPHYKFGKRVMLC